MPESVFEGCASLKSLVIPPTVKRIESRAVAGCTALESVVFPSCIEYIAPDAFEGCNSLHNLRVDGEGGLFYIGENDGYLYEAAVDGVRVVLFSEEEAVFIQAENAPEPVFDTKSTSAAQEEPQIMQDSAVDSMLADIMGDEKERNTLSEEVAVSEQETAVLSETMAVMSDSSQGDTSAAISEAELEKLFAKNEESELATHNADNPDVLDSKAQILADSVGLSAVFECEPSGELPEDPELFVIAEKIVKDENGKSNFSSKLITCCKTFARIQDYKRIIMLYGLPLDNEEFALFFKHFIAKKNVILACEAESPATLSDFGKTICDYARISLKKEELAEQRRTAVLKTKTLVKLVIRDKYE